MQFAAQTGIAAAPVSFSANGEQYVAVAAGWGTIFALFSREPTASLGLKNRSRILAFRLGGTAALPALAPAAVAAIPQPPDIDATDVLLATGKDIYFDRCMPCHGESVVSGSVLPDLRHASADVHAAWQAIVLGGAFQSMCMPSFGGILSAEESKAVRAYAIQRGNIAYEQQQPEPAG